MKKIINNTVTATFKVVRILLIMFLGVIFKSLGVSYIPLFIGFFMLYLLGKRKMALELRHETNIRFDDTVDYKNKLEKDYQKEFKKFKKIAREIGTLERQILSESRDKLKGLD